jgi:hypothetical protein
MHLLVHLYAAGPGRGKTGVLRSIVQRGNNNGTNEDSYCHSGCIQQYSIHRMIVYVDADLPNVRVVRAGSMSAEIRAFLNEARESFLALLHPEGKVRTMGNLWSKPGKSFEDPGNRFATLARNYQVRVVTIFISPVLCIVFRKIVAVRSIATEMVYFLDKLSWGAVHAMVRTIAGP